MSERYWLGMDMGSISANLALIGEGGEMRFDLYRRVDGDPLRAARAALAEARTALPTDAIVAGAGATGSARHLIGVAIGADTIKNEISAHACAAVRLHPDVRTVFEIGGQDSKATMIRDGVVVDFAMNLVCAAGTGSFLDAQAKRLALSIEDLSAQAMRSVSPTPIAGRCTVFAESDMIHKQQVGHRQEDIVMGLCLAMARNFLNNVCAGKEIAPPILLQGGVSANLGIRRAFEELLGQPVIVPRHAMVMGAYGAALLARAANPAPTRFRGFDVCEHHLHTRTFSCDDCANRCEIVEILDGDSVVGRSGGRCGKWEGRQAGSER